MAGPQPSLDSAHGGKSEAEYGFEKTRVESVIVYMLWILVCFIVCDSSFFLLCSLPSLIVVHYARDCSSRLIAMQCGCVHVTPR